MLTVIIIISLFCNGLWIITRQNMLLFKSRIWLEDLWFTHVGLNETIALYLFKPILGCIRCMASFWGVIIVLLLCPLQWELLYQIPIICIAASAGNAILYNLYE